MLLIINLLVNMKKAISLLMFVLLAQFLLAYTVETVPNVKLHCQKCYVSNPDMILTSECENQINEILGRLEKETTTQVAVVVVDSIDTEDFYDFAYRLFNYWKIGDADKDNGLLILFVADQRTVKIETGYGLEGLLPDIVCDGILNEVMFPAFKQGDYDKGFLDGVQVVYDRLTTDEAKEELLVNKNFPKDEISPFAIYLMISCLILIICAWAAYFELKEMRGERNIRYRTMGTMLHRFILYGCIFLPVLPFTFWLWHIRKKTRYDKLQCCKCGQDMHLLSETEEDAYLSSGRQTEEKLKSVNYDVWVCDNCKNQKIFSYVAASAYTVCPNCGSKTYKLESNVVTTHPTTISTGRGIKTYCCKHCKYKGSQEYVIPVIVISSSSNSRGSSFGGGSWGGGSSGGGGAGGHF
ncbi:MAG: TPM domain-containing protein [Sphingobacteriia bacterium]|nr:TPM domain-containing protein [Sphingobacteriia bacterium]